jgi:hypothetical protein
MNAGRRDGHGAVRLADVVMPSQLLVSDRARRAVAETASVEMIALGGDDSRACMMYWFMLSSQGESGFN